MNQPRKCTATKPLLLMLLLSAAAWVQAAPVVGTVAQLSGPLFVKKADGSVRILGVQSAVEVGDTLSTQGKGYAQVRLKDDSLLTMQPNTAVSLDTFTYEPTLPAGDEVVFSLKQGSLRSDAGALGKRSPERSTLITPAGRIGLQAASVVVQYQPEAPVAMRPSVRLNSLALGLASAARRNDSVVGAFVQTVSARYAYRLAAVVAWVESWVGSSFVALTVPGPVSPSTPGLAPGLYVSVIDGAISLSNKGGSQGFTAGQFGFTASVTQPPVVVPANPGLQFTLPPVFSLPTPTVGASAPAKSNAVDCEVR